MNQRLDESEQLAPDGHSGASSGNPGEQRVTPEEVALAAAALEARRETDTEKSVTLLEAIEHLGLDMTARELLLEVEALRAERAELAAQKTRSRRTLKLVAAAITCVVLAAFMTLSIMLLASRRELKQARSSLPAAAQPLVTRHLAAVPEGVPVHIDSAALAKLARVVTPPPGIQADVRSIPGNGATSAEMFANEWTIVKSGSNFFVDVWAPVDQAMSINREGSGIVFSEQPTWLPAGSVVQLRVPVFRMNDHFIGIRRDGSRTVMADSLMQAGEVLPTADAVEAVVSENMSAHADKLGGENEPSRITVDLVGDEVRLSGTAYDPESRVNAAGLAREALRRIHVTKKIDNQLEVE
jgi:hypothetical protein